ncbi:IucA/IucC family siderophore biosynthesis protein [Niastella caeni]|uniref:IucA/IucC family siderophore biosynthesis protein n=1 Tax=Niastella caeni TaxID=2569763 RepID=A0A4S8HV34_9BACT|nr:IucA/IucC family siderophore biosynthesis protein [Niastella caeni]THU39265.1 IucA/IucC family siderophore biosynthesis protein [Niastella caeni]
MIQPLGGTQPLDIAIWQKVNTRLLAKSIAELMHEQVALPTIVSEDNDGRTNFHLATDHAHIHYTFSGYKRQLDYWHIEPQSIQRHNNDENLSLQPESLSRQVGRVGGRPATDAPLFFVELQNTFGIRPFTLAHYVEELLHTLYADAYMHAQGRFSASQLAKADYQCVEHQMDGHPWVIVNKSRLGFNYEDYMQYAPEANQQIQLSWIAVHKNRAAFRSLEHIEEQSFFAAELGQETIDTFKKIIADKDANPADYTFMPVHPWQWNNQLLVQYATEIANKWLIPLGSGEDMYSPQQSIRTFYNASQPHKYYVKTAISILSTGNIRGLSPRQMAIAPRVTSWVMNMLQEDAYLQSLGLVLLGEVATVSYTHPYYHSIVDPPYQYKEFLGVLWRESAEKYLQPGERIVTMASLLYVDDAGKSFVGELVKRSGLTMEAWLQAYLQAYLKPLLQIYYQHSLCVTPHGENIILVLKDDVPVRIIIKDFVDDIVLTEEAKEKLPEELVEGMIASSNKDNVPLFILLGVFDAFFRYLSNALHTYAGYNENEFWQQVYDVILEYQAAHPALANKFEKYNLFVPEFKRFYINSVRLLGNAYEEKTSFAIPRKGGTLQNPLAHIRQQALSESN